MKYQQIIFPEAGRAVLEEKEETQPLGADEVAGSTVATILSAGTELNQYLGHYAEAGINFGLFPVGPGYGCVFEVEEVGSAVTKFVPGDLAFGMGPHASWQRREEREAVPVPAGLEAQTAVFARIMNITMTSLTMTMARPPEEVIVMGLGAVGLLGAQIFQSCGYRVSGVDLSEERRGLASAKGLALVAANIGEAVDLLGGKAVLGMDCTGHEAAVVEVCQNVKAGGEVVVVGVPLVRRTEIYAQALLDAVFRSRISLRSGTEWIVPRQPEPYRHNFIFGNLAAGLQWLAEKRVRVDGLADVRQPVDPQKTYEDVRAQKLRGLSVVFDWNG